MPIENAQGVSIVPGALAEVAAPVAVPQLSLPAFQAAVVDPAAVSRGAEIGTKIGGMIGQALEKVIYPFTEEGKAAKLARDLAAQKLRGEIEAQDLMLLGRRRAALGNVGAPQSGTATAQRAGSLFDYTVNESGDLVPASSAAAPSTATSGGGSRATKMVRTTSVPSLESPTGFKDIEITEDTDYARELELRTKALDAGVTGATDKDERGEFKMPIETLNKEYSAVKTKADKANKNVDPFLMASEKLAIDLEKLGSLVGTKGTWEPWTSVGRMRLKKASSDVETGLNATGRAQLMARIAGPGAMATAAAEDDKKKHIPLGMWTTNAQALALIEEEKDELAGRIASFYLNLKELPPGLPDYMKVLVREKLASMKQEIPKQLLESSGTPAEKGNGAEPGKQLEPDAIVTHAGKKYRYLGPDPENPGKGKFQPL